MRYIHCRRECVIRVHNIVAYIYKMKTTKYHTVGTDLKHKIPHCRNRSKTEKKNRKRIDKIDATNTWSLTFWLGICTSMKSGGVKLVIWSQTSHLSEMMRPCNCFLHWIIFNYYLFMYWRTLQHFQSSCNKVQESRWLLQIRQCSIRAGCTCKFNIIYLNMNVDIKFSAHDAFIE